MHSPNNVCSKAGCMDRIGIIPRQNQRSCSRSATEDESNTRLDVTDPASALSDDVGDIRIDNRKSRGITV